MVEQWWHAQAEVLGDGRPPSVQWLQDYLCEEYGYRGSYKSVRKFVRACFGRPRLRPFRRGEIPPGAQTRSDKGEFRGVDLGNHGAPTTVYAFVMVLSRKHAWHHVHNETYHRLGEVVAVNRIDNLKTGVARGCGAWGMVYEQYRVYARTMGFHVDACEVRWPEQKGKTERWVGVWKWLPVRPRAFDGLAGLQAWTDTLLEAGEARRVCPAIGCTVAEHWGAAGSDFAKILGEI